MAYSLQVSDRAAACATVERALQRLGGNATDQKLVRGPENGIVMAGADVGDNSWAKICFYNTGLPVGQILPCL